MRDNEARRTYQELQEERRATLHSEQWKRGTELETLLKKAETDIEAARLIELARLIDPASFKSRENQLESVQRMRLSAKGNDPSYQSVIETHERVARLNIDFAVRKAQAVLGLVRSWD